MVSDVQIKGQDLYQRQQSHKCSNGPVIICDGLQTPDNLGSILRVADATGSKKIVLLDSELDLANKKISKLARSTDRHLSLEHSSLADFIDSYHQYNFLCALEITTTSENVFNADIKQCDAVIVGHESYGIREEVLALCNATYHLPMFGINGSMNISHALAVFLYEWRRQTGNQ